MAKAIRAVVLSLRLVPSLRCRDSPHYVRSLPPMTAAILTATSAHHLSFLSLPPPCRYVHFKSRGLKRPVISTDPVVDGGGESSDSEGGGSKKSRNEKKRDARRAVRWGMELASFSTPQIKRIVRVASLEREVFDALILAKKLGPDVREGKRRQFNYIGKLLRDAEPELLSSLIQATKDGDYSTIETLAARKQDEDTDISEVETDQENEEKPARLLEASIDQDLNPDVHAAIVQRWFDGLVNSDIQISNQVYSLGSVEFDRQGEHRVMVPLCANGEVKEEGSTSMPWNEIPPNSHRRKQNKLYRGGFSLGVDLGLSRTGLAISKGFSIRPLKVSGLRGQKLERMLMNIAEQREVDEFIIGLPTSYDGKETPQSNKVRSVAGRIAALAAERGWRVYLQGEYGTSLDAMQMMIDRGLSKSSRQENLDSYAAMVVLQRYFSTSGKDTELVWPKKLELQEKLRYAAAKGGINHGEYEDFD